MEKQTPGPQDYANAIRIHAVRAKGYSLYPGPNYRALANFIKNLRSKPPIPQLYRPAHDEFKYAALHDLALEIDDPGRITLFDGLSGLDRFEAHQDPQPDSGQILFLRGYPSPDWMRRVGARYRLDPEFFRRQLSLGPTLDYFDLPALPSSSENIIHLNATSIGRCDSTTLGRQASLKALQKHFQNLGTRVGESIVRRFSWHDEEHFSIDQQISAYVTEQGPGWVAIVLLDNGRDLNEGPTGPWFGPASYANQINDVFLPGIQSKSRIALEDPDVGSAATAPCSNDKKHPVDLRTTQSASLLPMRPYGLFHHPTLVRLSPFYALHPILAFCASAESQFQNLVQSKLDIEFQRMSEEDHLEPSLRNQKYHKQILQEHIQRLRCTITFLKYHGCPEWPQPFTKPPLSSQLEKSTAYLLADYEDLHHRADLLHKRCAEGMDDVRNTAMLLESKKAIKQAEAVTRITILAFFFIPLSFTTSFFGMNFREFGTGRWSIWIWFAVSVPVFGAALVLCFWDGRVRGLKVGRKGDGVK